LVLKEIPLAKERTTIGRKPHNDIQIDNLAVSGEHAVIVTIMNDCFLEDLGSTNGTLVNGAVAKKHFLQNNDVIELGKYKLKFINEGAAPAAAAADFEKTMVLRPAAMKHAAEQARAIAAGQPTAPPRPAPAAPAAAAAAPAAAPAAPPAPAPAAAPPAAPAAPRPAQLLGAIQILSGASAGRELELTKPLTTLGRPGVQVAVLTRRPQGYFLTHVEGAKQPHVNGQAIGTAPCALKDHDLIELAGVKMEFFLKS
jgi:pyruvate/2-oxoglutarate dehydrogenase complex dihydrolipoamide acyltransferase (E2) component